MTTEGKYKLIAKATVSRSPVWAVFYNETTRDYFLGGVHGSDTGEISLEWNNVQINTTPARIRNLVYNLTGISIHPACTIMIAPCFPVRVRSRYLQELRYNNIKVIGNNNSFSVTFNTVGKEPKLINMPYSTYLEYWKKAKITERKTEIPVSEISSTMDLEEEIEYLEDDKINTIKIQKILYRATSLIMKEDVEVKRYTLTVTLPSDTYILYFHVIDERIVKDHIIIYDWNNKCKVAELDSEYEVSKVRSLMDVLFMTLEQEGYLLQERENSSNSLSV